MIKVYNMFVFLMFSLQAHGKLEKQTILVGNSLREYVIYIPENSKHLRKIPLLFALHGGGGKAIKMAKSTKFHKIGEAKNWIVVYPQAMKHRFKSNWNDGRVHTQKGKHAVASFDDVGYMLTLLKHLKNIYPIDSGRIYLMGVSNGGFMAQKIAAQHTREFSAFASVIGSMSQQVVKKFSPNAKISLLIINGTKDPLVPYEGGMVKFGRNNLGYSHPIDKTVNMWVKHNNLELKLKKEWLANTAINDGCIIEKFSYTDASKTNIVEFLKMHGGGHTLAGSKRYLPNYLVGRTCYDIDASRYIIEFFTHIHN